MFVYSIWLHLSQSDVHNKSFPIFFFYNRQQTKLDGTEKNKKREGISQSDTVYCVMLTDKILICTMEFSSSAFHSMFLNGLLCVRLMCVCVCVCICMNVVEKIGGEKERAHIEIFGDENGESIFLPVQNVHKLCVAHTMGMKKWQQRRCTQTRDADNNIY